MKNLLTIVPLLAILATSSGAEPEEEHGYKIDVSQSITEEESRSLDAGSNHVSVGPDVLTYTPLTSSAPIDTRIGPHQHHRMTFDTSNLPLCSDRPGWNDPVPATEEYKSPGRDGEPDCLMYVYVIAQQGKLRSTNEIVGNIRHGKNAIAFNYPSGPEFRIAFMMAGGRSTTFNATTGEVTKTNYSWDEVERKQTESTQPNR